MKKNRPLVDIEAELKHETDLAWLIFDGHVEAWISKSVAERNEDDGTFTMPEWLAKDKGFV